jgi:glyceraldehyde 3-phosphate dehydrogenase
VIKDNQNLEVVAVSYLLPIVNAAYLFKYDSIYDKYAKEVKLQEGHLHVDGRKIPHYSMQLLLIWR